MSMKLYNTLTGKLDEIKPDPKSKSKRINLFVCGPTVYDHSHIGHARTYTFFDVLSKYLKYKGMKPYFLINITDIDDKLIAKSAQTNMSVKEIVDIYLKGFLKDMKDLKVNFTKYAKATDYIPEIISQIQALMKKDIAYRTPNGIYFDITKFKEYGKLSKQPLSELKVHRIEPDPTKRNNADFSLWKNMKPNEPYWDSPWGKGRPGWHIEDTAIAMKFFGEQYDLHGGGHDLIFPHHEAEIAQAEAITGKKPYVKHWIHCSFLIVEGRKMSKSLGNILTIQDAIKQSSPEMLRLLLLQTHHRKELDYTSLTVDNARNSFLRLKNFLQRLKELKKIKDVNYKTLKTILSKEKKRILQSLDEDFDTQRALTILFTLIKKLNLLADKNKLGIENSEQITEFLKDLDKIFCILPKQEKLKVTDEIKKLLKERETARKNKDFSRSDEIRDKLLSKGLVIEDTKKGPKIKAA